MVSTLIVLLLVATAVALVTRRCGFPEWWGLCVAEVSHYKRALPESCRSIQNVILNLFLPILIFEARH